MKQTPTVQFLGGAGTVTGSKYLMRANGQQVLFDCWLDGFQQPPHQTYVIHGEPSTSAAFAEASVSKGIGTQAVRKTAGSWAWCAVRDLATGDFGRASPNLRAILSGEGKAMSPLQIQSYLFSAVVLCSAPLFSSEISPTPTIARMDADAVYSAGHESTVQFVASRGRRRPRFGFTVQRRQSSNVRPSSQSYPQRYNDFRPYNRSVTPSNLYRPYAHAPYYDHYYGP